MYTLNRPNHCVPNILRFPSYKRTKVYIENISIFKQDPKNNQGIHILHSKSKRHAKIEHDPFFTFIIIP